MSIKPVSLVFSLLERPAWMPDIVKYGMSMAIRIRERKPARFLLGCKNPNPL